MSATALLTTLRARDCELTAEGERLRVDAPAGALTADLRAAIAEHKAAILLELEAEANGWRRNPNGPGWIETPKRAARCVFCPELLVAGDLLFCEAHRVRMGIQP